MEISIPIQVMNFIISFVEKIAPFFKKKLDIRFRHGTSTGKLIINEQQTTLVSLVVLVTLLDSTPREIESVSIWDNEKVEYELLRIRFANEFRRIDTANSPIMIQVTIPDEVELPIERILIKTSTGKTYYSDRYPTLPPVN